MTAKLIKGTEIREQILEEITAEVAQIKAKHGVVPGLVTILVGANPASISYVTLKIQTGHRVGFQRSPGQPAGEISEKTFWPHRQVQQGRFHSRHPGAIALAQAYRREEGAKRHRSGQGCGWLPPGERRTTDDRRERSQVSALHPGRYSGNDRSLRRRDQGSRGGGGGSFQYCR